MDSNIAIKVSGVSKTFRIPHEKVSSLRGAAVSVFKRNKGYEEFKALDDVSFSVGDQILMVFFHVLTVVSEYANIEVLKSPVLTARHGGVLFYKIRLYA